MKCIKCKKTFNDTLMKCPFCNRKNSSNDKITKKKKIDNSEISLEKTMAINNSTNDNFSLVDDINKHIESMNEESVIVEVQEVLSTSESLKNRKSVLFITSIISLFIVSILICCIFVINQPKEPVNYEQMIMNAFNHYYDTNEIDDLVYVMEDIKEDESKLERLNIISNEVCLQWIKNYREKELSDSKQFEDVSVKYKSLIDGVYRYALIKDEDSYIRALVENDYDVLIKEYNHIYSEAKVFYDALDFYNEKDYNRSYYLFNKIDVSNYYYNKSIMYIEKLYQSIIQLLINDILKMEKGIDAFSDVDKLDIYIMIEEIILEYNIVYNVDLDKYDKYSEILNEYTEKVNEYSELVAKK